MMGFRGLFLLLLVLPACGFQKKKNNENNDDDTRREMELASDSTVGNGADSVFCSGKDPELLDAYEMRVFRGLDYSVGGESLKVEEKVDIALERLSKKDQILARRMKTIAEKWNDEVMLLEDVYLPDVNDSGDTVPLLDTCNLQQLAIQYRKAFPHDKRVIVDKSIWERLSKNDKAALIIHETYYRLAFEKGHEDSRAVRYFTALVMSNRLDQLTLDDYAEIVGELNLPGGTLMMGEFEGRLTTIERYSSGEVKSFLASRKIETKILDQPVTVKSNTLLEFYRDGSLMEASLCFDSLSFPNSECSSNESGSLKIGNSGSVVVPHDSEKFYGRIQFYPGGGLKRVNYEALPLNVYVGIDIPVPNSSFVNRTSHDVGSFRSLDFLKLEYRKNFIQGSNLARKDWTINATHQSGLEGVRGPHFMLAGLFRMPR